MPIQLVHASDIHLGSGENHGTVNPQTGLNVRFEDFEAAFGKSVNYALKLPADCYLFSGDAYRNASPEPLYQRAFARHLKRLSDAGIPTICLVGNHDQIWKATQSHSMSVFQTLEIPNLNVIDEPTILRLETRSGPLQIVGLPYVTRHLMMTYPEYASMNDTQADGAMVKLVSDVMASLLAQVDPAIPCVVTAHCMMDRARQGAEKDLYLGYTLTFPMEFFIDPKVDYVALGHVHSHQILREKNPLIAYAGSIERVDFSEEGEDKGFIHATIERGKAAIKFHSIDPRPFITVTVDLTQTNTPQQELTSKVLEEAIPGCVLRVEYKIAHHKLKEIDEGDIRRSLARQGKEPLKIKFRPLPEQTERPARMPDINEKTAQEPVVVLEKYMEAAGLENREALMARVRKLSEQLESKDQ